jgi:hypothetical protein
MRQIIIQLVLAVTLRVEAPTADFTRVNGPTFPEGRQISARGYLGHGWCERILDCTWSGYFTQLVGPWIERRSRSHARMYARASAVLTKISEREFAH